MSSFSLTSRFSQELIKRMENFQPVPYLLFELKETPIKNIFKGIDYRLDKNKKTIIIVCGPSGSGKNTVSEGLLEEGVVSSVTTATTRERRALEGEPEDARVWMRRRVGDESYSVTDDKAEIMEKDLLYQSRLIQEYDLVESSIHMGNIYGIPRKNFDKAEGRLILIQVDINGYRTLKKNLIDQYNIVSIFIVPESYEQLWYRISGRENPLNRIETAIEEIRDAKNLYNYYLLNIEDEIKQSQESFRELVIKLSNGEVV